MLHSRQRTSRPRKGEPVYQEDCIAPENGNGTILFVDHEGRQITVKYIDGRLEDYEFDDLLWTDKFGGVWIT
jgi:hypothetical protein